MRFRVVFFAFAAAAVWLLESAVAVGIAVASPFVSASASASASVPAQAGGRLTVSVRGPSGPVPQADVRVAGASASTDAQGEAVLDVPTGTFELTVSRLGFETTTQKVTVSAPTTRVAIELEAAPVVTEDVVVTATRSARRVQDLPLRVEVVPQEEIDEKLSMTPGDIAMMLTETNGLRVQTASPGLGAASVRVQGMRGRYTQILADGLPLYGPAGSFGLLQIPPMDLGQVEVIKGVASALYGASALGGVINLVSRRPADHAEREVLINRTSRGGTDAVTFLAGKLTEHWGYTLLGGGHWQTRADIDRDGWTDLPAYQRAVVRPRVSWEDGTGRSFFVTLGGLAENREGGTMPGARAPDGQPFPEDSRTRRFDAGLVGRFLVGGARIVTIRASGFSQWHRLQFGEAREHNAQQTSFAEASLNGSNGSHTWVIGAALEHDRSRVRELPQFDYTYTVPGVFLQDDYAPFRSVTISASGRVDRHNRFGAFFSPRISALLKLGGGWTLRPSAGAGFFAPTAFTEETEATGLSRLAPLGNLAAERGRSTSLDLGWKRGPLEVTATWFRSNVRDPVVLREISNASEDDEERVELVNAPGPTRTVGSELIARFHRGQMDLIATHAYVWATEPDPQTGIRGELPLNPRHSAGLDWLYEFEGKGRLGVELFYTGRQRLDESPYRQRSDPYLLIGLIGEWRVGPARLFLNGENLTNVKQTSYDRLVRPDRAADGRWTVDIWAPLEGRIVNGGMRLRF